MLQSYRAGDTSPELPVAILGIEVRFSEARASSMWLESIADTQLKRLRRRRIKVRNDV